MKRVFTGGLFFTLTLLLTGALGVATAGTTASLPGDKDRDGTISCNEAKQMASERFNMADTNKDNSVTLAEFKALTSKNFDAMDADKNGTVDIREYVAFWCGAPPIDAKKSKKSTQVGKKPLHKQMDSDKNGKVTSYECAAFWTTRFAYLDENKDGSITKDEFSKKVTDWFSASDVNKDGTVSITEYTDYWVGKCQPEKVKKQRSEQ